MKQDSLKLIIKVSDVLELYCKKYKKGNTPTSLQWCIDALRMVFMEELKAEQKDSNIKIIEVKEE